MGGIAHRNFLLFEQKMGGIAHRNFLLFEQKMGGIAHRNFLLFEQKIFNHTAANELAKYSLVEGFAQV